VDKPHKRLKGIQGLGWNPRVTQAERAEYERAAREDDKLTEIYTRAPEEYDGPREFRFQKWDEATTGFVASEAEWASEYIVAYFLEPLDDGSQEARDNL
ncbi:MAG: hypothetical protein GWO24_35315, partial [Akkermansiaceae bacterium]|nr:hypothetical protein [Akkermansiaceae bacterium]